MSSPLSVSSGKEMGDHTRKRKIFDLCREPLAAKKLAPQDPDLAIQTPLVANHNIFLFVTLNKKIFQVHVSNVLCKNKTIREMMSFEISDGFVLESHNTSGTKLHG